MKKFIAILLCMSALLSFSACSDGEIAVVEPGATYAPEEDPNAPVSYTVTVTDDAGTKLEGIYVIISLSGDDSVGGGTTDENGVATIELPKNDGYTITLMAVPDQYEVAESYRFTGTAAEIVLKTAA